MTEKADLRLVGINKTFDAGRVIALRDVNLTIERGEAVAVTGRSGSGKSTLLNILGLLDRPSQGEYWIGGVEAATLPGSLLTRLRGTHFGFVFQQHHLLKTRTAAENIELALIPQTPSPAVRRRRAAAALEQVALGHRRNAFPPTLSGGESQRVAIARALAQEPTVLLCDEPTGSLDNQTSFEVMEVLRSLNTGGISLVIVTHDETIARSLPRIVRVDDGRVTS